MNTIWPAYRIKHEFDFLYSSRIINSNIFQKKIKVTNEQQQKKKKKQR